MSIKFKKVGDKLVPLKQIAEVPPGYTKTVENLKKFVSKKGKNGSKG